ncbi:transposase family protein [Streptomyces milbemycinicus]|uniref:transposase family protein n=1 Tax=Streptomyces milbemycinicus TaxID=476552 RepID=UPI0033F8B3EC
MITSAETRGGAIRIEARCTASNACCPTCGDWSAQVHGSYLRFPADLACAGRPCVLVLRVRRFVCTTPDCPRRTFVEQVPGLTRRHGRTTERLRSTMSKVGLALAGRAGALKGVIIPIRLLSWVFLVDGEVVGVAWCGTR